MHAGVSVSLESGEQLRAPILVGADGVRSRVAANLGLKEPNYAGYIAYRCACQFLHMHMQICWVAGLPSYLDKQKSCQGQLARVQFAGNAILAEGVHASKPVSACNVISIFCSCTGRSILKIFTY